MQQREDFGSASPSLEGSGEPAALSTFASLQFKPRNDGPISMGEWAKLFFPNGYGASVIRGPYTYGGPEGLYELAVLAGDATKCSLAYDTPITDDVLGDLTEADVTKALQDIAALPARGEA